MVIVITADPPQPETGRRCQLQHLQQAIDGVRQWGLLFVLGVAEFGEEGCVKTVGVVAPSRSI